MRKKLPVFAQMHEFLNMVSQLWFSTIVGGGQSLLQACGIPGAEERN